MRQFSRIEAQASLYSSMMSRKLAFLAFSLALFIGVGFQNCAQPNQILTDGTTSASTVGTVAIDPVSVHILFSQQQSFSATGGTPPYKFAVQSGASTINSSTGVLTASASAESATVTVTDAKGGMATATVTVGAAGSCTAGAQIACSITGGTGKQTCSADGSAYGSCVATTCTSGATPVNGSCGTIVCGSAAENASATLTCPTGKTIQTIDFSSYGTPTGACGAYVKGSCNSANSVTVVTTDCKGKASCQVPATNTAFGGDPCSGTPKHVNIQVECL